MAHPEYDKYFCKECGKKFYNQRRMELHEFQAHSPSSVTCEICQKTVPERHMAQHKTKVHGVSTPKKKYGQASKPYKPRKKKEIQNNTEVDQEEPSNEGLSSAQIGISYPMFPIGYHPIGTSLSSFNAQTPRQ